MIGQYGKIRRAEYEWQSVRGRGVSWRRFHALALGYLLLCGLGSAVHTRNSVPWKPEDSVAVRYFQRTRKLRRLSRHRISQIQW